MQTRRVGLQVASTMLMTLRASCRFVTLSSYTQTQRSCWTRLRVLQQPQENGLIDLCTELCRRPCRWVSGLNNRAQNARSC